MALDLGDDVYKDFLCEYPFDGGQWSFTIKARSHKEAIDRLCAMPFSKVLGEIGYRIPAGPGAGLLTRAICAFKNAFGGGPTR